MCKILVVDDEQDTQFLFENLLERYKSDADWRFFYAPDGGAALRQMAAESPLDAVLLDIMMPDMDGLDLLEQIKQRDPHVGVAMLTAHPAIENIQRAMLRGASGFLPKPYQLDHLVATMRQLINWTQHHRQAAAALAKVKKELETAIKIMTFSTKVKTSVLREGLSHDE
jgi:two-component system OmpR family response regulator